MTKLWFKILKDEKLIKSNIFEFSYYIDNPDNFFNAISEACHAFDIPTPVILSKHYNNFLVFNICTFVKADFVENYFYDSLVIENATVS